MGNDIDTQSTQSRKISLHTSSQVGMALQKKSIAYGNQFSKKCSLQLFCLDFRKSSQFFITANRSNMLAACKNATLNDLEFERNEASVEHKNVLLLSKNCYQRTFHLTAPPVKWNNQFISVIFAVDHTRISQFFHVIRERCRRQ